MNELWTSIITWWTSMDWSWAHHTYDWVALHGPVLQPILLPAFALLVGLIVGSALKRPPLPSTTPNETILDALDHVIRGDKNTAASTLTTLSKNPDAPPSVYFALASILRSSGLTQRSALLHRALLQRSDLPQTLRTRATIQLAVDSLHLGHHSEAHTLLESLPRSARKQPLLLSLQRRAAIQTHDFKRALSLSNLLAKHSTTSEDQPSAVSALYTHMASHALRSGHTDDATRNFKRALKKDPENLHAREGLAALYTQQGKHIRARRLIKSALSQNPDLAPRLFPLMRVALGSRTRYQSWLNSLHTSSQASPWTELELAQIAFSSDDVDRAFALLEPLLERFPRSLDVREAYLNLLVAAGNDRALFAELDRFMALATEFAPRFTCRACNHRTTASFTQCPSCKSTGTVVYDVSMQHARPIETT